MLEFGASLFWYKILFMAELIVSELLFAHSLNRQNHFALRSVLCVSGLLAVAFFMPIVAFNAAWAIFMFLSMFALTLVAMKICFAESWWNVLFCGLAAYIVQHLAYTMFSMLSESANILFDINRRLNPYSNIGSEPSLFEILMTVTAYIISYFLTNWIAYYVYARRVKSREDLKLGNTRFVLLAGIIILTAIIFSLISQYNDQKDLISAWLERGFGFLTCLLALQLQFSQLTEKEIQVKLDTVQQVLYEEQKQYEIVKQNIDIINIKCHDLKQQIRTIRLRGDRIDGEELEKIEDAVSIYESVVKTGNETLDLILTEKNLICKNKGILLTCIADGAQLNFIKPADIYSLFGNALDNAMEAVMNINETKRNIGLSVKKVGKMISIHVENYFAEELVLSGGLPVTTKKDIAFHGYGLLSIKSITQKYGGTLAIETVDNTFNLNILLPGCETDFA